MQPWPNPVDLLAKVGGAAIIVYSRFMLAYELAKGNKKNLQNPA
jgi:hypothetical protein